MNNQVKLIDANKVIVDMERRMNELLLDRSADYDRFPVINALENFVARLKSDTYDPDTPPVPTIKPGDTVKCFGIIEYVTVVAVENEEVVIMDPTGTRYTVTFDDLEVVE